VRDRRTPIQKSRRSLNGSDPASVKTKLLLDGNSKQKPHIKFEGLPESITKMRIKLIARQIIDLPRPIFQIIAPADRDISCQQHDSVPTR
jgi:hypothetical protein